jgi:hypothetical protein
MNGLWIRVVANIGLRKVVWRACDVLGTSVEASVGHLVMLWGGVAENTQHGRVDDVPDALLEAWAGWHGESGAFARFVREHHVTDGRINEWDEYAGALEDRRTKDRERKRRQRSTGSPADSPRDVRGTSGRTERNENGTERDTTPPPSRATTTTLYPELQSFASSSAERAGLVTRLLDAVAPAGEVSIARRKFGAVMNMALQNGLTAEQLESALRDWLLKAEDPDLARFRGYLKGATAAPRSPPGGGNGTHRRGEKKPPQQFDYTPTKQDEDPKWQN